MLLYISPQTAVLCIFDSAYLYVLTSIYICMYVSVKKQQKKALNEMCKSTKNLKVNSIKNNNNNTVPKKRQFTGNPSVKA